jgi:nitrogen regulatory protein PII
MTELSLETDSRLISCVVPKGRGAPLQKALADNKALHNATLHHGRGVGKSLHSANRSIGDQQERDILEVIVGQDKCDEIFEYIFFEAKINEPHGGIIYVSKVSKNSHFELPDVAWEKE